MLLTVLDTISAALLVRLFGGYPGCMHCAVQPMASSVGGKATRKPTHPEVNHNHYRLDNHAINDRKP
jgi:hypothetical protein